MSEAGEAAVMSKEHERSTPFATATSYAMCCHGMRAARGQRAVCTGARRPRPAAVNVTPRSRRDIMRAMIGAALVVCAEISS